MKKLLLALFALPAMVFAQTTDLLISEYGEGAPGQRKYIELYNGTGETIDLTNYRLRLAINGAALSTTISLTGTLTNNAAMSVGNSDVADATITSTQLAHNGDDAIALEKNIGGTWTLIDVFGIIGDDPGTGWAIGDVANATVDNRIGRNANVCSPATTWNIAEWTILGPYNSSNQDTPSLNIHTVDCAPATSCSFSAAGLTGVTCHNNDTPTVENDDNIKFSLNPTAVVNAATYNVSVPTGYTIAPTTANFGEATEFTVSKVGGSAGAGNVVVTLVDATDATCTFDVTVTDPGICSSATPVLSTSVNTLALANYTLPFAATQGQFTFTGLTLAGDVTVAVTGNFEISKDNVTFANTLTYPLGSETVMTDSVVYVRSTATAAGVNAGTITVSSSNATDATVAVSTTVDAYTAMTFADAKTLTEGGTPVNNNQKVIVTGTTNCTNFYNNTRYNFYLLDENQEGIYIYRNPSFAYYTFNSGDSLRIYGKVAFFNGLTQIVPDSITLVGAATFTDFTPVVLDGPMVEAHESNYMIIEDVAFATPQTNWPTNGNVTVVKGGIEYEVRIVSANPLSGTAAPTTPTFSMVGYVSQYATVAPYTTGYQFFPCGNEGIIEGEVVPCANPATGEVTYDATTGIITATDVDASYSYQWIACGPDAPEFPEIMFQTAQTFQVTSSGSYAVRVANSNPGCSVVESECLEIEVDDSAVDNVLAASTMVYPNPFNTSLTIVSEKAVSYTVVDVQGKTIATTQSINGKVSVNTESWLQGVYFIQLVGANAETHTVKVIK